MTNYVLSVMLRMFGLWRERGFGWWLIGGLWAATYNLLLLPTTVMKNIMSFNQEQAERALPMRVTDGPAHGADSSRTQCPPEETTEFRPDATRRPSSEETYRASDSPYHLVNLQLDEARATLTRQQEAVSHCLAEILLARDSLLCIMLVRGKTFFKICDGPTVLQDHPQDCTRGHQVSVNNSDHVFPMASRRMKSSSVSRKPDSFSATRDVSSLPRNTNGRNYTGTEIRCHIIRAVLKAIRATSMVIGGKQTLIRNTEFFT
jgi:hypothetical protein